MQLELKRAADKFYIFYLLTPMIITAFCFGWAVLLRSTSEIRIEILCTALIAIMVAWGLTANTIPATTPMPKIILCMEAIGILCTVTFILQLILHLFSIRKGRDQSNSFLEIIFNSCCIFTPSPAATEHQAEGSDGESGIMPIMGQQRSWDGFKLANLTLVIGNTVLLAVFLLGMVFDIPYDSNAYYYIYLIFFGCFFCVLYVFLIVAYVLLLRSRKGTENRRQDAQSGLDHPQEEGEMPQGAQSGPIVQPNEETLLRTDLNQHRYS